MHGTLWNIASKLPVYGDDITAVQGMTSVVDSLIGDSAPQFMNVLTRGCGHFLGDNHAAIPWL